MMTRDYKTLDAILVVGLLALLAYAMWALITREIPQAQLAILSSLVSGAVVGTLGLYAGSRWGNKKPSEDEKKPPTGGASVSLQVDTTAPEPPADRVD